MAISNSLVKVGVFRSEGDGYQPPGEEVFSKNHLSIYFQIYFPSTTFSSCCFQSVVTRWASRSCAKRGKPTSSSPSPRWTGLSFNSSDKPDQRVTLLWGFLRRTRCRLFWPKISNSRMKYFGPTLFWSILVKDVKYCILLQSPLPASVYSINLISHIFSNIFRPLTKVFTKEGHHKWTMHAVSRVFMCWNYHKWCKLKLFT